MKSVSELRQDIVSKDWVVVATGRGKRPHAFLDKKREKFLQPKSSCPFESFRPEALYTYPSVAGRENMWQVQVVKNKFPAFSQRGVCAVFHHTGPYQWTDGVGHHEVVISRDHRRSIAEMSTAHVEGILRAYQERYVVLQNKDCVEYVSIFHNHGSKAGASIAHPHSQIIAIPVIPPDVARSLIGSKKYFAQNSTCAHCVMIRHERRGKSRVVYENEQFISFAPFASRTAFELRIYPKLHRSRFEHSTASEIASLAATLRTSLAKLFYGLHNPDYNFFLHTTPAKAEKDFSHYHWHFEILPKTAVWAGFEIGTGIEISTIAPEQAAAFLRKIKTQ